MSGPRSLLRPEYGPTLPALLRARHGVAPRVTLGVAALVVLVALVAALTASDEERGLDTYVHSDAPAFNLLHPAGVVRRVAPAGGELARLEARGRRVVVSVVVRPLPPYAGPGRLEVAALPILAVRHADGLRAQLDGFALGDDGRARVNDAPGYQLRFRAGPRARPLIGHDVLLLPTDGATGGGVLLSLRQQNARPRLRPADRELVGRAKKVFRSFRFGTERP